ncbi:MAG TPA: HAD family hydrolase [Symbiobacteriaceae bacterium]
MINTILFDLDGTLLPIDTDEFVRGYMKALAGHAGHLVPPQLLVQQVMASTHKMIENVDPNLTNAAVFAADFFPKVGRSEAELMPVFDSFYREKFPALKATCPGIPGIAREVVQAALDKGYEIVLATNPLFPRLAIEERMRWVGVEDMPWRLVTTYEDMCACKPRPQYYEEILRKIGRKPEECLMVGNDVDEDGIAGQLGLAVYIVTDHLIKRSDRPLPPNSGTLAEFLQQLRH